MIYPLDQLKPKTKIKTKNQNIFAGVNENSTFLYTLNRGDKKTDVFFFFFKVYNKVEMLFTKIFGV